MFTNENIQFSLKAYMKAYVKCEDQTITIIEHGEPVYFIQLEGSVDDFDGFIWNLISKTMYTRAFYGVTAEEAGEIIIKIAEENDMYDICHKYL